MAQSAQIDDDGDDDENQIDPSQGLSCIHDPRIYERRQRQEQKSQQRHEKSVISAVQIVRKEE